jgi:hypothetical protein
MNRYSQTSGRWTLDNGSVLGAGYSGNGPGKNNGHLQMLENIGPIPQGEYRIGGAFTHPSKGPLVMNLIPKDLSKTYTRSGFLIHGDSIADPGNASLGCIVLPHDVRQKIADCKDKDLTVIY